MNSAKVLVLDADMTPALAVTRSLGRSGLWVDVASTERRTLTARSRYARRALQYPDPLTSPDAFCTWLRQQLDQSDYVLVYPVTERTVTALLPLLDEPALAKHIALPPRPTLELALDKEKTLELARSLGIPCPTSWCVCSLQDLDTVLPEISYPVVIKPARSIGDNGHNRQQLSVSYAHSAEELRNKLRHFLLFGDVLVQEYVRGDGVGIEIIASQGEIRLAFQHRRLHELPLTGGGSTLRESVPVDVALLDAARRLIKAMNWHGVAMVEFKHDPGDDRFSLMEVNGRFWGSLPLSIAAGADFPVLLHELLTSGHLTTPSHVKIGILARKLSADLHWHELVLRKQGDPKLVEFPRPRSLVRDAARMLLPRHHFDVQQWRDPVPGLIDLGSIISGYAQRLASIVHMKLAKAQQRRRWRSLVKSGRLANVKSVLFLCYGNINRSVVAHACLEQRLPDHALTVCSAGFHATEGRPADPAMRAVAVARGIDLEQWRSRTIGSRMVEDNDLILVMEFDHLRRLRDRFPAAADKCLLLGMVPGATSAPEIADPYGQSTEFYRACFDQICDTTGRFADLARHSA